MSDEPTTEAPPDEPVYVKEARFSHIAGQHESYVQDCPPCENVRRAKVLGGSNEKHIQAMANNEDFTSAAWAKYLAEIDAAPERLGPGHADYVEERAKADAALEDLEHERHAAERDFSYEGCPGCDAVLAAAWAAATPEALREVADFVAYPAAPVSPEIPEQYAGNLPIPTPGDIVMYVLNQGPSRGHPRPMMITSTSQNIAAGLPMIAGFIFLEGHDGIENNQGQRMLYAAVRGCRYDDSPARDHQLVEGTWHYREQAFPTFQLLDDNTWARVVPEGPQVAASAGEPDDEFVPDETYEEVRGPTTMQAAGPDGGLSDPVVIDEEGVEGTKAPHAS